MNIFVTHWDPHASARVLPDKHVVKMPLETTQMVSLLFSPWYYDWGEVLKKDGTPYDTKKGAFRNHPCTKWAADSLYNTAWLIQHGCALVHEYWYRYDKIHACAKPLFEAKRKFQGVTGDCITCYCMVDSFTRAMPNELKYNTSIDTFTAYKNYISSKPSVASNYLRKPSRKPDWV